jgi:hypothetical protein
MSARIDAMIEAGLVECDACHSLDEPHRMAFNMDGSAWLCNTAAAGLTTCADSEIECAACLQPTARRDLGADGCGCLDTARWWLSRIQAIAERDARFV